MLYRLPIALTAILLVGDVVASSPPDHRPSDFYNTTTGAGVALDGVPDNTAIQAAFIQAGLDGGEVVIDGVYEVRQGAWDHLGNPYRQYGVYITGNAETVRVRCTGGGGFRAIGPIAGVGTSFSMVGVLFNNAPVFFEGCHFDMSGRESGFSEQQHALQLFYGAQHVHSRDLVFFHPSLGDSAGGDCVRMVGGYTEPELVRDVSFTSTTFLGCDRSDFSFQRSVQGVTISHFVTIGGTDQNLDQEATGVLDPIVDPDGLTRIRDVRVSGATIIRPDGGTAVTMGRGIGMTLRDSTIFGAEVNLLSCEDCHLDTVQVVASCSGRSAVAIKRAARYVTLHQLDIRRYHDCPGGADPLVYIVADAEGQPTQVFITSSSIRQGASNVAVMARASQVFMVGNVITYAGPTPATANAVAAVYETLYSTRSDGSIVPNIASGIMVGNVVTGPWYAVANVSPHPLRSGLVGPFSMVGNVFDGPKRGLRCITYATNPTLFRSVVRSGNNNAGAPWVDECPIATAGM